MLKNPAGPTTVAVLTFRKKESAAFTATLKNAGC
jgi:hypothetical protein